jgi:hypothetical protein
VPAFESYLLILESGAGGYVAAADEAKVRELAAHVGGQGWVFGCRSGGYPVSKRRGSRKVVDLTLLWTMGQPDQQALVPALQAAGTRHGTLYRLRQTWPGDR